MSIPATLIAQRYRLVDRLGTGAMGEVWKAQDLRFDRRFVAIKLLREDDTHREDATNRERLQRLLRDEAGDKLTVTMGVNLLDEVLQCGKGVERLRTLVKEKADAWGRLKVETVLGLYDELVDDPSCSESARIRSKLRRLFRDEANSVADLRHDNIVSISDYGEEGGVPYLAMDYIDGQTLLRLIQRGEPVPRARQLRFMEDLCSGLAYAHKRHLVHRDIKPANLIVEHGTDSLKILDFGVVKRLQDTHESTMGLPIGTLCYMSPEQIAGSTAIDHRSDVFAVGSVFYELLAGRKAFPAGEGMADLMARIQKKPPQAVTDFVPDLEPAIETILERALRKEPDERYQFLTDMQRDLRRIRAQIETATEQADRTLVGTEQGETTLVTRGTKEALFPRLLRRGEQALEMGDVTLALESATQVLELDPTNQPALNLQERANALALVRQRTQGAEQARSQLAAGDLSQARKTAQKLREIDADSQTVRDLIAEIERAEAARGEARARAERVENLVAIAQERLNTGAFEDAIAAAEQALQLAPTSETARNLAADAQARLAARREREAQAAARESEIRTLAAQADEAMRARDFQTAVERLRDARDLAPDRGELAQRLDEAERALEQERKHGIVRKSVAQARDLLGRGQFTEAADALGPARQVDAAGADVQAVDREIAAARKAHEERLAKERVEADATIVVQRADRLFTKGARQEALDLLAGQQTLHPSIAERLRALQEEQIRLTRKEEEEKKEEKKKDEERRRREIEKLRIEQELPKTEPQRIEQTTAEYIQTRVRKPEEPRPVQHHTPWYRSLVVIATVAVLLVGGVTAGVWQMLRKPEVVPGPVVNPPPPPVDFAPTLAEARKTAQADPLAAIALVRKIPAGARERADADALLKSIRNDATAAAAAARQKAVAASATTQDAFRDGDRQLQQADGMSDVDAAVPVYVEAARSFNRAATAELTPQQLFQAANAAARGGKTSEAIDYALRAYERDSSYRPALEFLNGRRSEAARQSENARRKAAAAGASPDNSEKFRLALGKQQAATAHPVRETREALAKFREATTAFEEAETAHVLQARTQFANEIRIALGRADELLKSRDVAGAQAEVDKVRAKDPTNSALQGLDQRLSDARAEIEKNRRDNEVRANKTRAADLLRESRGLRDADAITRLEQAAKLDPGNEDIKTALEARQKSLNDSRISVGPGPVPTDSDTPAINKVLDDFAAAYNQKSMSQMRAVFPTAPAGMAATFSQFDSLQWQWISRTPKVSAGAGRGSLEATATVDCEVSITQRSSRIGENRDRGRRVFTLEKSSGRWLIVSYGTR